MRQTVLKLCTVGALLIFGSAQAASVGILIEKTSEMLNAPVEGFKSVMGADALVLDMAGDPAMGKTHCATMKSQGVKLVFAVGKDAALTALKELPATPVVFAMVMNPGDAGLKGPNITGVSLDIPMVKQFEAFKSVVPAIKKIGLAYGDETAASLGKEMKAAGAKTGLTLVEKKIASEADVPNAIRELKGQVDGLYLPPDRLVAQHDAFQFIALFTFENNLPFMAPASRFVKKGALVALMVDYEDIGKQAGDMAKKILAGTAVSTLPVEPPRVTVLVLNQKTAQTIGINIPPSLLENSQIIK